MSDRLPDGMVLAGATNGRIAGCPQEWATASSDLRRVLWSEEPPRRRTRGRDACSPAVRCSYAVGIRNRHGRFPQHESRDASNLPVREQQFPLPLIGGSLVFYHYLLSQCSDRDVLVLTHRKQARRRSTRRSRTGCSAVEWCVMTRTASLAGWPGSLSSRLGCMRGDRALAGAGRARGRLEHGCARRGWHVDCWGGGWSSASTERN